MMYQHKESLEGKRADEYMDMYALGCIAFEIYSTKRVWENISNASQLVMKIVMGEYPDTTRLSAYPDVQKIVQLCFKQPQERVTMAELLKQFSDLINHDLYS